jgi:predicted DNA-binding transcriptional regulator YafY
MQHILRKCFRNKRTVTIVYMDHNERITQRNIRILRLDEHYVHAYCLLRKMVRTFDLHGLLAVRPVPVPVYQNKSEFLIKTNMRG